MKLSDKNRERIKNNKNRYLRNLLFLPIKIKEGNGEENKERKKRLL